MGNADALSHWPVESAPREHDGSVLLVECHDLPMTAKMIRHTTKQDPVLSRIAQSLVTGYNTVPEEERFKPYLRVWSELSVEQGCILRGARVVIPEEL